MSLRISVVLACLVGHIPCRKLSAQSQEIPGQTIGSGKIPAGPSESGFLLPNGWRLTPAGKHVLLTDLPLNILTSSDGKYAFVATSGYNTHELTAIELATGDKIATAQAAQSWFGLAADSKLGRFWWSGGGEGSLHHLRPGPMASSSRR